MKDISFPVLNVKMVNIDKLKANNYNPNKVAPVEFKLLQTSIEEDGYTQPIVTYYDKKTDEYIIVDGFHRLLVGIKLKLKKLPVVVIEKNLKQRMESTIRHNRAKGEHQIDRVINIISELVKEGRSDDEIMHFLGMESDELLRLKQHSTIAEVFKNHNYSQSWK
ncbi:MAG: ParB/RepB/Spo0J family partition protein [Fusobacteriales bacterium]|jgi:ParB-like chromosome segregation protein Spo0J|nr:ParB/RepB/Spo0J family partition protein [Fusobacteriales bacterium]